MARALKTCSLCGERVEQLVYQIEEDMKGKLVAKIRQQHPAWVKSDGACEMCLNYFRNLLDHRQVQGFVKEKVNRAHRCAPMELKKSRNSNEFC